MGVSDGYGMPVYAALRSFWFHLNDDYRVTGKLIFSIQALMTLEALLSKFPEPLVCLKDSWGTKTNASALKPNAPIPEPQKL